MNKDLFFKCVEFTKENEGGYTNDPNDHGGPTSRGGVTLAELRHLSATILGHEWDKNHDGVIDEKDLQLMTDDDLEIAYKAYYDDDMDNLHSETLVIKLFDFRYNCGPVSGVKLLQRAINNIHPGAVVVDGQIGSHTVAVANSIPQEALTVQFIDEAMEHYRAIVAHDPTQNKYLKGWTNRANRLPNV